MAMKKEIEGLKFFIFIELAWLLGLKGFTYGRIGLSYNLTAYSHLAGRIERPNPKLLSRGEDRSSLKYIITVFLSDSKYFIEKMFGLSTRVWVPVFNASKFFSKGQTLHTKSAKKCCHVGTLEVFHL